MTVSEANSADLVVSDMDDIEGEVEEIVVKSRLGNREEIVVGNYLKGNISSLNTISLLT